MHKYILYSDSRALECEFVHHDLFERFPLDSYFNEIRKGK